MLFSSKDNYSTNSFTICFEPWVVLMSKLSIASYPFNWICMFEFFTAGLGNTFTEGWIVLFNFSLLLILSISALFNELYVIYFNCFKFNLNHKRMTIRFIHCFYANWCRKATQSVEFIKVQLFATQKNKKNICLTFSVQKAKFLNYITT